VVKQLIQDYTAGGAVLYDPFCGSGTLLVEALVEGRSAIGSDVDPVAVFVSRVKSTPLKEQTLRRDLATLQESMDVHGRSAAEYERLQWQDLSDRVFAREREQVWLPAIPNLEHWFRRYVLIDLGRMLAVIQNAPVSSGAKRFFSLVFASIVRGVSNADPVPVSGLEVTSHMKRRDAEGRLVDPFRQWDNAAKRAITQMTAFAKVAQPGARASAFNADATSLPAKLVRRRVDAVITSPPYHGAVDYYRRHQLEMYWLQLIADHEERLDLLQRYIGRTKVAGRHPLLSEPFALPLTEERVEAKMREVSGPRADAFRHYCVAMGRVFAELAKVLPEGAPALFVVGHSVWRGTSLNTSDLFAELSQPFFRLDEVLDYPVKNRYMSYARRNGASIDHEYVLVLRRTSSSLDT
jgi:16S rRNA G966 N2-methylase RsmD